MGAPFGNFSYAWAGAVANDAAAGDVAITNPNNASGPPDGTDATCVLTAGQSTQYAKATTFTFYPPIPSTATIKGIMVGTKGSDSSAASLAINTEVKIIKGGAISGNNLADGQPFSSAITNNSQNPMPLIGKSGTELGGLTITPADITADTNWGVAWRWVCTSGVSLDLDAMLMIVYWEDTPAAVITETVNVSDRLVGEMIGAEAYSASVIGHNRWERSRVRWQMTSYPVGFTFTSTDSRRGDDVEGVSRDWSTDVQGYVYAVKATHAGTYTLKAYIDLEDGTTLTSNTLTFTVAARSGTTFHVKPSTGNNGNTGLSEAQAWQTFAYACTQATDGCTILLYDDQTFAPGAATSSITSKSSWLIKRSGGGAAKPLFEISTAQSVLSMTGCADIVFEDLNFGDNSTRLEGVAKPNVIEVINSNGIVMTGCDGDDWGSVSEVTSSGTTEACLFANNTITRCSRYFLFIGGTTGRDMVVGGNTGGGSSASAGEGWIRFSGGQTSGGLGCGGNVFWNSATKQTPGATGVSYSAANPTVVTSVAHGLLTGSSVTFAGSTGTSINGSRVITRVDADSFTVPVNVASPGTANYYVLPQVFVRPGWSFLSVWANRVDSLYFNVAEASSSTAASFMLGNRFTANDVSAYSGTSANGNIGGVNQRGAIAPFVANNLFDASTLLVSTDWDDGDAYWYTYVNNTFINDTYLSTRMAIDAASGEGWFPYGFTFHNNLLVMNGSWAAFYLADSLTTGTSWIDQATYATDIAHNVYRRNGTAAQVRFKVLNANKLLAEWNAYDSVVGDEYELNLAPGDVLAATNFLPASSFTVARGNAVPVDGVFEDYVGSTLRANATTWPAGATGGNPSLPPTSPVVLNELYTTALISWTLSATAGITRYIVRYGLTAGALNLEEDSDTPGSTIYIDSGDSVGYWSPTGLTPGSTYYFEIVAVDDAAESDPTTEEDFTLLQVETGTGDRIYITAASAVETGTDVTNEANAEGAPNGTVATITKTGGSSAYLGGAFAAADYTGQTIIAWKVGAKLNQSALHGAAYVRFLLTHDSETVGSAVTTVRPTGTLTEYESYIAFSAMAGQSVANFTAHVEAGEFDGTIGIGAPNGASVQIVTPGGTTTVGVDAIWIQPVLAGGSGGAGAPHNFLLLMG